MDPRHKEISSNGIDRQGWEGESDPIVLIASYSLKTLQVSSGLRGIKPAGTRDGEVRVEDVRVARHDAQVVLVPRGPKPSEALILHLRDVGGQEAWQIGVGGAST